MYMEIIIMVTSMRGIFEDTHSAGSMKRNRFSNNPHSSHFNKRRCRLHASGVKLRNAKCEIMDSNDNETVLIRAYKSDTCRFVFCLTLIRLGNATTSLLSNPSTCLYPSNQCSMLWTTTTANMRRKKYWTSFLIACFCNIRFFIALHCLCSAINYWDHI